MSGARCYWHTRVVQLTDNCKITNAYHGDWHSSVEYDPQEYPIDRNSRTELIEYVIEEALKDRSYFRSVENPIRAYLSCLSPRNLRDRFILVCLLLEDLSKKHKFRLISKKEWKLFVKSMTTRFPTIGASQRFQSNMSHLTHASFVQRLKRWAIDNDLEYADLDDGDPFRDIVITRNNIVHGLDEEELTDETVSLQLAKAMTLLERYIFTKIGWDKGKQTRPMFDRLIYNNRFNDVL